MPLHPESDLALERLCAGLEPAQRAVLAHDFASEGPLLVLAGAGTGKTTTLTRRLALELARNHPADQILALTFTRKAAHEMRERVAGLLAAGSALPEIRTFHSLGLAILSEDGARGWKSAGWAFRPKLLSEETEADESAKFWRERFREGALSAPTAKAWTRMLAEWGDPQRCAQAGGHPSLEAWREWEAWKRRLGVAEMHDLISASLLALESDPGLLERWRARARTLFVDEYQDTDRTQYRLVSLLAGDSRRVMAVGDDDQSIYGFRGADMRNILDWRSDRPDGRILTLTGNHRSRAPILAAANRVFPDKPPDFRKELQPRRKERGEPPLWFQAREPAEELAWIRKRMEQELRQGTPGSDLCALFRGNREEAPLRKALRGLPVSRGDDQDGIRLLTIHAAKGLEWPAVFVCGQDREAREGRSLAPYQDDEERRLFYVACTRARDRLYLSSCASRPKGKSPREHVPHPWMDLVEPDVGIRPRWLVRTLRRFWHPAAARAIGDA
ncbi:MAG TPA: ATP-dependent helicase [Fibrobacteria bacterium]|nr:ATP-dependent helicase [Fibrobacteria bacterium]